MIRSGNAGDITIKDKYDKLYEVIEVKFDIPINYIMVRDCYDKIKSTSIQRYYILSTKGIVDDEEKINDFIKTVQNNHGCQIIINGILPTIKYYLRLISNTDLFIKNYLKNLENNPEINHEHKISWNKIISNNMKQ